LDGIIRATTAKLYNSIVINQQTTPLTESATAQAYHIKEPIKNAEMQQPTNQNDDDEQSEPKPIGCPQVLVIHEAVHIPGGLPGRRE